MNEPLIVLKGLENNLPATLTSIQAILAPHADTIIFFWWVVWSLMLIFMATRYVLVPLIAQYKERTRK